MDNKLPKLLYDPTGTDPNPPLSRALSSPSSSHWYPFLFTLGISLIFVGVCLFSSAEWIRH